MADQRPVVLDTFAEAFDMKATRLVVTAHDEHWLDAAIREFSGYSSSVIACDAEIGVESRLSRDESPDGRPGVNLLAFGFSYDALGKALVTRVGQCLMTCPTTAVFDGMPETEKRLPLGKSLRFFGDGYQKSKQIGEERFWRVPVMDGEFWVVDDLGACKGIGGGNLILQGADMDVALTAARTAVDALMACPDIILPFPGGVARSGSKVGSRYKGMVASTADAYCPTLKGRVDSELLEATNCALEIVVDGLSFEAIQEGLKQAVGALLETPILAIGAGNYGGKLGAHHFRLADLCDASNLVAASEAKSSETTSTDSSNPTEA